MVLMIVFVIVVVLLFTVFENKIDNCIDKASPQYNSETLRRIKRNIVILKLVCIASMLFASYYCIETYYWKSQYHEILEQSAPINLQ